MIILKILVPRTGSSRRTSTALGDGGSDVEPKLAKLREAYKNKKGLSYTARESAIQSALIGIPRDNQGLLELNGQIERDKREMRSLAEHFYTVTGGKLDVIQIGNIIDQLGKNTEQDNYDNLDEDKKYNKEKLEELASNFKISNAEDFLKICKLIQDHIKDPDFLLDKYDIIQTLKGTNARDAFTHPVNMAQLGGIASGFERAKYMGADKAFKLASYDKKLWSTRTLVGRAINGTGASWKGFFAGTLKWLGGIASVLGAGFEIAGIVNKFHGGRTSEAWTNIALCGLGIAAAFALISPVGWVAIGLTICTGICAGGLLNQFAGNAIKDKIFTPTWNYVTQNT
ncbi:MAG: hypothetical protein HYY52_05655 [Candidatus Melainabacteria bacterium]|nr:hypothetical protein [Candidatus Melainabacteria bacterium]